MNEFRNLFFKKGYMIFLFILIIAMPLCMFGTNNLLQAIVLANYPTLILVNLYLLFAFYRTHLLNDMMTTIVPRKRMQGFYILQYKFMIISLVCFVILFYGSCILIYGLPPKGYEELTIIYSIYNLILYFMEELIISFQIGKKKNIWILVFAIALNFIFHYGMILPRFNGMF